MAKVINLKKFRFDIFFSVSCLNLPIWLAADSRPRKTLCATMRGQPIIAEGRRGFASQRVPEKQLPQSLQSSNIWKIGWHPSSLGYLPILAKCQRCFTSYVTYVVQLPRKVGNFLTFYQSFPCQINSIHVATADAALENPLSKTKKANWMDMVETTNDA